MLELDAVEHLDLARFCLMSSPVELRQQLSFVDRLVSLIVQAAQDLVGEARALAGWQLEDGAEKVFGGHDQGERSTGSRPMDHGGGARESWAS
jgi:hypothetical protein